MYWKLITILIVLVCSKSKPLTEGCRLFCVVCRYENNLHVTRYYCCMEDWETEPIIQICDYESTTSSSTAPAPPTATPCPTLPSLPPTSSPCPTLPAVTPTSSQCPAPGTSTEDECATSKRIYPRPIECVTSNDCSYPFNVCCDDNCYGTRICKTFQESFLAL